MDIHEHQAKDLLKKYNIPVPRGAIAYKLEEIEKSISDLGSEIIVVKAQIHAGGRGKAGGVKVLKDKNEAKKAAQEMFGKILVTNQTGPKGKEVRRVYFEEGSSIKKEYYLSALLDREVSSVTFIASSEGGMDIEEVADKHPEKIVTTSVDIAAGMQPFHARKLAFGIGLKGEEVKKFTNLLSNLYKLFIEKDLNQLEINPLIMNDKDELIALDGKINFDDNALFKHPEIQELRDIYEEDELERQASQFGLSYVKMDGNIGCMVNGAGLAMATMDIIKLYGAEPANFLDVGGGANQEKVKEAFKIILSDKAVEGILVNIFGGIMRCDVIAEGIIAAAKEIKISVPLVVRLSGTNFEKGREILEKSGLNIHSANDLAEAAEKIVKLVK